MKRINCFILKFLNQSMRTDTERRDWKFQSKTRAWQRASVNGGEGLSWNNNCHEKPNQREEQSGWRDYSRDSSFGIPCEVDACLAAAIGKTTDITAKANTWSAALACWRTNASPINPSTSSLLFIITGYSVFQKAIIGANSFSNLRTYETIW